jgi:hypothetical protein
VRATSMRILFALAGELNLDMQHIDITTAFLNGELTEEIYMMQPEGFVKTGNENKVCRLKKAIYGPKQAARSWNTKIHTLLIKLGFKKQRMTHVYTSRKKKGN